MFAKLLVLATALWFMSAWAEASCDMELADTLFGDRINGWNTTVYDKKWKPIPDPYLNYTLGDVVNGEEGKSSALCVPQADGSWVLSMVIDRAGWYAPEKQHGFVEFVVMDGKCAIQGIYHVPNYDKNANGCGGKPWNIKKGRNGHAWKTIGDKEHPEDLFIVIDDYEVKGQDSTDAIGEKFLYYQGEVNGQFTYSFAGYTKATNGEKSCGVLNYGYRNGYNSEGTWDEDEDYSKYMWMAGACRIRIPIKPAPEHTIVCSYGFCANSSDAGV